MFIIILLLPTAALARSSAETESVSYDGEDKRNGDSNKPLCYQDLGCFTNASYFGTNPSSPGEINVQLLLHTRRNQYSHQTITYNNMSTITNSNFRPGRDTKIIIHGFSSRCTEWWVVDMRLAFLRLEDVNVICVDWRAGAVDPYYVQASANTRLVGKMVALLLRNIGDAFGAIGERTHIVGFSLGAHVAGFVGKDVANVSRITGLDPAGPLFEGENPEDRLDKTDAALVDVIHSNGDTTVVGGFGCWEPIGHVDFYPNGGTAQPGCKNYIIGGLYDYLDHEEGHLCNHQRAYHLFTQSLSPSCRFTAFPCQSYQDFESGDCFGCQPGECGRLGYHIRGRGKLYLRTLPDEPFCADQLRINLTFARLDDGSLYTYGQLLVKLVGENGLEETFEVTSADDEMMSVDAGLSKLILAHPRLGKIVEAHLLYSAYNGWVYSGHRHWRVNKMELVNVVGQVELRVCRVVLVSGIPTVVSIDGDDCRAGEGRESTV